MNSAFDIAAIEYDTVFTHSKIGKLQRDLVYKYLKDALPKDSSLQILEINCGTGADALWLAEQGHHVIATDISEEMIRKGKQKVENTSHPITFQKLDINDLDKTEFPHKFDLIFSDFGGLNCLSPEELKNFFKTAKSKLQPDGQIIGVIMPKYCLLETLYFSLKGSFKKAFRRNTNTSVDANVDGVIVPTWYYNPKQIQQFSKHAFNVAGKKPIGLMIPPSYLEPFFIKKNILLKLLQGLDSLFNKLSFLAPFSDHYIITLSRK